jgi:plasmid maintenance system killer protein
MYRDKLLREQSKEKIQPNLENEITRRLMNIHLKEEEEELEKMIAKKTKHMNPIQAFMYRDKLLREQGKEKTQPNLENELTRRIMETHLKDEEEEMDSTQSQEWKEFEKMGRKKGIHEMKRKVRKWLGREKSDIREKIEKARMNYVKKLEEHKQLIKKVEIIEEGNRKDGEFIPLLEEAMEKNRVMMQLNYKDHINKILGNTMENYWKKCRKENQSQKKRLKRLIREANWQRKEILEEHQRYKEVFGLYGQVAYSQKKENSIRAIIVIFETWEDIGKPGMKFFKEEMIGEIETSFTYQLLEEIVTETENEMEKESFNGKLIREKRYWKNIKILRKYLVYMVKWHIHKRRKTP